MVVSIQLFINKNFFTDAPTCAPNQQRVYGVAKQEQAQIKCIVDANPSDVEFKWTFNNSAESIDVASNHVTRSGKELYLILFFFFFLNPLPFYTILHMYKLTIVST